MQLVLVYVEINSGSKKNYGSHAVFFSFDKLVKPTYFLPIGIGEDI